MRTPFPLLVLLAATLTPAFAWAQGPTAGFRMYDNLVYARAAGKELQIDLAVPEGVGPFPAVLCIHAGGMVRGDRREMAETIRTFARHGYVGASLDYRLVPEAKFPAQIEDCKAAVRWLRANAGTYKINPRRIGALGYSTGGYLACLLGTTDARDGLEGTGGNAEQSSRVQAVVSFFAPTDFTHRDWTPEVEKQVYIPYLGATFDARPDLYRKASPLSYATADDPPFLLFHGDMDTVVELRHSRELADRLRQAGVQARLVVVEGEGHGWGGAKLLDSLRQMMDFLDEHLKP
ncbi:MAG TPA: alpha/beta hydrolase [Gemmataceae bacterium]|nr:alpha/beta hydrolase [Gemmataceae bacterium]